MKPSSTFHLGWRWLFVTPLLFILLLVALAIVGYSPLRLLNQSTDTLQRDLPPVETVQSERIIPSKTDQVTIEGNSVTVPRGWDIRTVSTDLKKPRHMTVDERSTLYLSDPTAGTVYVYRDTDGDAVVDRQSVFVAGLSRPHGLVWHRDVLYVAEEKRVIAYGDTNRDLLPDGNPSILLDGLPQGGNHTTRSLALDPRGSGTLFVSIGSSCNVCVEESPYRASVWAIDLTTNTAREYASGLRNAVGIRFDLRTNELVAVDNGRDLIGDDLPPEELNIVSEGGHYGWPYCYANGEVDRTFSEGVNDQAAFCASSIHPLANLQAHSAPLDVLVVGEGHSAFNPGDMLITYHGSWNRTQPTGYKVVLVHWPHGDRRQTPTITDIVTGFMPSDGTGPGSAWGRPVGLALTSTGFYLTDDAGGRLLFVRTPAPLEASAVSSVR